MTILKGIYARGRNNPVEDVNEIQRRLNREGAGLVVDGVYGANTEDAVMAYQQRHGLKADGVVGPITLGLLTREASNLDSSRRSVPHSGFANSVIKVAESYVGVRETGGDNRGKEIDAWLAELGLGTGYAWCMAFVQACFREAARRNGFADPLKPDTAGVLDLWNRVPDSWKHGPLEGRAGDIMIMDFGGGKGHTGIVTGYNAGIYDTIEGNTNDAGGREGDCVAVKIRNKYNSTGRRIVGFVRVPDPAAGVIG